MPLMEKLKKKMERIRRDCGAICETQPTKVKIIGKKWYNMVKKDIQCSNMFNSDDFDTYGLWPKPPGEVISEVN